MVPPTRPAASSAWSARTSSLLRRIAGVATNASLSLSHARDQRLDEAGRRQQRIALEVDHQVGLVQLRQRFGAALGAVAAFGRGHDHADAEAGAQASAIRSSSVTTNTPETPRTRRAASTLRWISGLATPLAPFSSTSGFPG